MQTLKSKWLILSLLGLTWGSSFILIKKSLEAGFTPYQIGSIRVLVSGIILMGIAIPAMRRMDRKTLFWLLIAGALGNFFPMFLFPMAQTQVSSSMAGILDSLVPAFVLLLGFVFFNLKSKRIQWLGAGIGFLGAGSLVYFSNTSLGDSHPGYALLIVLATACYAGGAILIDYKLGHIRSLHLSASVFTIWMFPALVILIFSGFFQDFRGTSPQWEGLGYLGVLSVVGTALAILLYYQLIQNTSAVFASMVTYLLPLVAVFWGVLVGESFTFWYALGGAMILLGIYLAQDQKIISSPVPEESDLNSQKKLLRKD